MRHAANPVAGLALKAEPGENALMVKLNRIYTRTGDGGETGLVDGSRLPKHHRRLTAIGEVDETSACIGVARLHVAPDGPAGLDADLSHIQNDLFDLGADIATPDMARADALRITPDQVRWLERRIDALNENLAPLRSFVLPAGQPAAAHLHVARAVCRRAERALTGLAAAEEQGVNPAALAYVNRLSDYLFVAARVVNAGAGGDVAWVPGANRKREV